MLADGAEQALEQHDEPLAAGVDDPRPPQHLQLVGRARERLVPGLDGAAHHVGEVAALVESRARALRGRSSDGEHGALDGAADRGVRLVRRPGERVADGLRAAVLLLAQDLRPAAQQLAEDHPGVAPRTEQRTRGEGVGHLGQPGVVRQALDRRGGGLDGEVEVGAGVAVRHREDVEPVDLVALLAELGEGVAAPLPSGVGVEVVEHAGRLTDAIWAAGPLSVTL